jgi:ABC-type transport system substrate-binding protein
MITSKLQKSLLFVILVFVFTLGACTKKVDDKDTTLNVAVKANIKGLDPIRANDVYSALVIANLYEGLLEYSYLKRPMDLQPALADGMPVVSDNGLTHTFKIKKGVLFHDDAAFPDGKGREVTAEDFIYSWKRLSDPKTASEGFWIFDGKIKGLNEWVEAVKAGKADYSTPIEGLQAPDKYTIVIKLIKPYYQLDYVLATPYAAVMPKEAVDKYKDEIINHPVGTGPYMLENWVRNSKITLKKNPKWHGETYPSEGEASDKDSGLLADAGKPLPFAEKVTISEITEDQPRWQNFMKGNLDFSEIPNDNFESTIKNDKVVPDLTAKGMSLHITPGVDVTYVAFNMKDPLFAKNKALRQAMALANDSKTSIEKFFNGRAIVAQGPVPPNVPGFDPNYKNPFQTHDLEKAKALLAKAGFANGKGLPEITYETLADSKSRQMAEFFQQDMAKIGVKIRLSTNTWPQFQEKIKGGTAQTFGIAWTADYPDGQNFFQLFYGKNLSPGPNDSGFTNAEFDKIYEQSLLTPPGPERDKLYFKLRDIVVEESPWIFNVHRLEYHLIHGWVGNFKYSDFSYDWFKYVRIDAKKRAELKPKL